MLTLPNRFVPTVPFLCQAEPPPPQSPPPPPPPPQSPPPPPPSPPPPPLGETPEQRVARIERALADTRAEAAAYRIDARTAREQITALEAQQTEARTAAAAEVERVRTNADSHLQQERQLRVDAELKAAAVSAGLVDPDLLPLINRSGVKIDAAGNITGLSEAIAAFKTAKPLYFREPLSPPLPPVPATRSTGLPPPPAPGAAPPTTDVRGMEKKDYNAAKREGIAALRRAGG